MENQELRLGRVRIPTITLLRFGALEIEKLLLDGGGVLIRKFTPSAEGRHFAASDFEIEHPEFGLYTEGNDLPYYQCDLFRDTDGRLRRSEYVRAQAINSASSTES